MLVPVGGEIAPRSNSRPPHIGTEAAPARETGGAEPRRTARSGTRESKVVRASFAGYGDRVSQNHPARAKRASADRTGRTPTLGIGLPVYNGERYLRQALDSLVEQSFTDYELVILDNASTDGTAAIALEYEARDSRIRYHRNPENIGAARNFNLAFELTSGRYFKWAADDDLMRPSFLERCVAALEGEPRAVLAYPQARIIDERGEPVLDYDPGFATDAQRVTARFASMLTEHKCFQIFGVIRRDALEQTRLIGLHAHGDGVLLAHLALLGRFVEIPEFLFLPRRHPEHSSRMIGDYWSYAAWFDPAYGRKRIFPHARMFGEYFRVVMRAPLSRPERLAVFGELMRVLRQRWRLIRGDILYHVRPVLVAAGVPERLVRRRPAHVRPEAPAAADESASTGAVR
jgi:glycosyltransferase involved in cell wall biosynthesis